MTIVAYDGVYLAADGRSSKDGVKVSDTKRKIIANFDGVKFKGSPIEAVARAGTTTVTRRAIRWIRDEHSFGDNGRSFLRSLASKEITFVKRSTLLVITKATCWIITILPTTVKVEEVTTLPIAIGSGSKAAMPLLVLLKLNALTAARAVEAVEPTCGGHVTFMKKTERRWLGVKTLEPMTPAELQQHVLVETQRSVRKQLGPKPKPPIKVKKKPKK